MRKYYLLFAISIVILLCHASWIHAQNPGGYDVITNLTPPPNINAIKDAEDEEFKTITQRCEASGIPSGYFSVCCQPREYWLNSACPYQLKGQSLVYNPQQPFTSDEENQAYQSVIDCLGAGGNGTSCQNTSTIDNIIDSVQSQHDTCAASCESAYQSCQSGCTTTTSGGDGPYEDATANAAYRAAVQCLQSGTANCLHVVAAYGLPTSWVSQIVGQADSDVQNGTVWQSQPSTQTDYDCVNACVNTDTTCVNNCVSVDDTKNKMTAATQQAISDWNNMESAQLQIPQNNPTNTNTSTITNTTTNIATNTNTTLQNTSTTIPQITPTHITDQNGAEIQTQDVFQNGLSDTMPVVTLQFPLANIKAGEKYDATVTSGPPYGFPVQSVTITPNHDITSGSLDVTVGDHTTPQLFIGGGSAPGKPDYPLPKKAPDSSKYAAQNYVRVEVRYTGELMYEFEHAGALEVGFKMLIWIKDLINPFSSSGSGPIIPVASADAETINVNGTSQIVDLKSVVLLHYNLDSGQWDELNTENTSCNETGLCTYTALSSSAGTFALVVKKNNTPADESIFTLNIPIRPYSWLIMAGLLIIIIIIYLRFWRKKALALKLAKTTAEKREAFRQIGFWRYVIVAGAILYGGIFAILADVFIAFSDEATWDIIFGIFFIMIFIVGPLFGLLTWSASALYYRLKK